MCALHLGSYVNRNVQVQCATPKIILHDFSIGYVMFKLCLTSVKQ